MKVKTTYNKTELSEFKKIILEKIKSAEEDLSILRASCANDADNGTEDTSPTFKAFEEGSTTLSKEENTKLAERQAKFIVNLKFNNNIDSISVLSLKIKLSTITKKLPCNSLNNNSFENTTYCILIAIFTVFLILTKSTFNFSKSNMLFFKLKKSILNFKK